MKEKKKKTKKKLGQISQELIQSQIDSPPTHTFEEQGKEMMTGYVDNLIECSKNGVKQFPQKDFFIVVRTKKEPLMLNVLRNYFTPQAFCPRPDYDQAVFLYKHKDEVIEHIWVVPDRDVCLYFLMYPDNATNDDERAMVDFIQKFADKKLAAIWRKYNGKEEKTIIPHL